MDEVSEKGAGHMITRRAVADALAEHQTGHIRRLSLDEIHGDWVTVAELSAWTGLSKNAAYEICRQEPLRGLVVRFGRQIRIPKRALKQLMDGE